MPTFRTPRTLLFLAAVIAGGCAAEHPSTPEEKSADARRLILAAKTLGRQGKPEAALAKAEEASRLEPDNRAYATLVEILRDEVELHQSDRLLKAHAEPDLSRFPPPSPQPNSTTAP